MQPTDEPPLLHHSLQQKGSSVLCLAADSYHIYSGSQGYDINVSHRGMSGRVPPSVFSVQGLGQGNLQTQDHTARTHRKRSCSRVCTGREVALQRIRHVCHADLLAATDQRCTGDSTIRVRTALASLPILADCAE